MSVADSTWDASQRLLVTRLQGKLTVEDVESWKASLKRELARIEDGTTFRFISDLSGYEFEDISAHKAMRSVVPLTLATYGFRTALIDLVNAADIPIEHTRGITCQFVAHVHHDGDKMTEYDRQIGKTNERFFTDFQSAIAWIETLR